MDVLATPHWRAISRLSNLEVLQIADCTNVRRLLDTLAELPQLKKLSLIWNRYLHSLPPSLERFPSPGCWPSLQALYRRGLRESPDPGASPLKAEAGAE